jgi:hypothetical protein
VGAAIVVMATSYCGCDSCFGGFILHQAPSMVEWGVMLTLAMRKEPALMLMLMLLML